MRSISVQALHYWRACTEIDLIQRSCQETSQRERERACTEILTETLHKRSLTDLGKRPLIESLYRDLLHRSWYETSYRDL